MANLQISVSEQLAALALVLPICEQWLSIHCKFIHQTAFSAVSDLLTYFPEYCIVF